MKQKSIKINALIYSFRNIINLLLPLITFPYVCRVLSVESLGKANFAVSIVNYFLLIAGLGIASHGKLAGARIRDDREKLNILASELFTINLLTTIAAYLMLFVYLLCSKKAEAYTPLLLIGSINLCFSLVGLEWIFDVYEEYIYITIRSIAVQIVSAIFLFIFVKDDGDLYFYAVYTLMTATGSNLLNIFQLRKMVRIRLCFTKDLLVHLVPILVLFANMLASTIYLNSDVTLLGYLSSDTEVGYYNVAVKIYNLLKVALASITAVSGTRLAYLYAKESRDAYYQTFSKLFHSLLMLAMPATIGAFILRDSIILVISGEKYLYSADILAVLLIAMLLALIAGFMCGNYTLVSGKTKYMLYATIQGAALNIILNFLLIPQYGATAAAFTTVLAEALVLINLLYTARNEKQLFEHRQLWKNICQFLAASFVMAVVCYKIKDLIVSDILQIIIVGIVGVLVYFSCLLLLRNQLVMHEILILLPKIKSKLKIRKKQ